MAQVKTSMAESYQEVEKALFDRPLQHLPQVEGISIQNVIKALIAHRGEIVADSRSIFISESDFRSARPKLLHPRGVCSSGTWVIDEDTPFTGLFENGTEVPAIVRFSSGTSKSRKTSEKTERIFGLAVKLFPTQDKTEKVVTTNIITLDQYGFEASARWSFFFEDRNQKPVYFSNVAPAKSFIGKTLATFFDRFDKPNFVRQVYKTAQVNQFNETITNFKSPYEIRFRAFNDVSKIKRDDFRDEILAVNKDEPIQLETWIYRDHLGQAFSKKIGYLILDKSVVSEACDKTLHFHHNRTIDKLSL